MFAVFRHTLGKSRGAILGWGLTLAVLAMLFIPIYDSFADDIEAFEELLEIYPPELMAFFGENVSLSTLEGFISLEFFSFMPLVLGVYAVLAGSGLIAGDEESGVLDLVAAQPVSRSALFWGRLLSIWASVILILSLGWVGMMFATTFSIASLDGALLVNAFASLGALLFFFVGLALMLSMVLPSRRSASMMSGIVLVASFFITGLASMNETIDKIADFSPLTYYQGDSWVNGLESGWFLGLMGSGLVFMLLAWWRFVRRDIRVGGEGGWKLKLPKMLQFGRGQA